jgi:hypothetical protein
MFIKRKVAKMADGLLVNGQRRGGVGARRQERRDPRVETARSFPLCQGNERNYR